MTNWPEFDEHPQSVLVAVDGSGNRTYHVSLDEQQYNQARDAIAAMQWRPIETAPSDEYVWVSMFAFNKQEHGRIQCEAVKHNGEWILTDEAKAWPPTHWMPLPPQPTGDL